MVTLVSSSPCHQPSLVLEAEQVVAGAGKACAGWWRPGPAAASA